MNRVFLVSRGKLSFTLVVPLVSYWNQIYPKSCCMLIAWCWFLLSILHLRFYMLYIVVDPTNALEIRHRHYWVCPRNDFSGPKFSFCLVPLMYMSFFLSLGLATEVPKLTNYWVVLIHPRASAKVTSRLCPFIVLVCYVILPVYLWSSIEVVLILRPAPFIPTGATGFQWRLLPHSLSRSWCLCRRRLRLRSCVRVYCRLRRSFFLFPRQPPVYLWLFPPLLGDPCPPPSAPSPRRVPESVASQWIARPYSVSGGPMSVLSLFPLPW